MRRLFAWAPLVVLLALAVVFATFSLRRDPEVKPDALVGRPVPAVVLPTLDGRAPAPLGQHLRGWTLVNFFASWCAPCELEHPHLAAMQARGARIVGVAYKDDPAASRAFLDRLGDPFSVVLVDRLGRAGLDFGLTGVPETFLVGPDGVVAAKHAGPLTAESAQRLMATASRRQR